MVRQRLVLIFLILGVAVFFLGEKEDAPAIIENESEVYKKSISNSSKHHEKSRGLRQVEQQMHSSSTGEPLRLGIRKSVPVQAIRGASSVDLRAIKNARVERSSFFEGTPWKIWAGAKAVAKKNGKPDSNILGEVNGFYLIESAGENVDIRKFSSGQPLVVIDSRLDLVGIVTGVFSITLKEGVAAEVITQASGIKILNSFPAIRTYFITAASEPFDLQTFQDLLKNESDIEYVHAEILSRRYEKN